MVSTATPARHRSTLVDAASSGAPPPRASQDMLFERPAPSTSQRRWSRLLFILLTAIYSVVGVILAVRYDYHNGDGLARTANASYVLFSRYPHLAAVGFVWNPLPSLAQLPLLAFRGVWPELQTQGLAGIFMSAPFMAGSVMQVRAFMLDRQVPRRWTVAMTLCFAFHPIIVLYGANGMSEAYYIFFVLVAVRRLVRWLHNDSIADLVLAGIALGLGFLARYEIVAVAFAAAVMVGGVTYRRSSATERRVKAQSALLDAVLVSFPFVLSITVWAVSGYIITDAAFAQFTSVYGNTSQVAGNAGFNTATGLIPAISVVIQDILSLEVCVPIALLIALTLGIRRQDPDILPPAFLLGGGVAFVALTYVAGSILENIRYFILVVPLTALVLGLIPPRGSGVITGDGSASHKHTTRWDRVVLILTGPLAAVLMMLAAYPVAFVRIQSQNADLSDYGIRTIFNPMKYPPAENAQILQIQAGETISRYIDSLNLPPGSVIIDTYLGFPIVVTSRDMRQFTMTSDYDFTPRMNDPTRFGVKYFMVPEPTSSGLLDAINRRYPKMWKTGAGTAQLVVSFPSTVPGVPSWRMFRVIEHDSQSAS